MSSTLYWRPVDKDRHVLPDMLKELFDTKILTESSISFIRGAMTAFRRSLGARDSEDVCAALEILIEAINNHGRIELTEEW